MFFQILQITLLIADYMNMIGKTAPGLMTALAAPPGTPKANLSRAHSRASSRARGIFNSTAPNTPKPDRGQGPSLDTPKLSGNENNRKKWSDHNLD